MVLLFVLPFLVSPFPHHPRRRPDLVWVKLWAVTLLLQCLVIDQSPREGAGVQEQQEQRKRPRGRAAIARVPVLHSRRMLSIEHVDKNAS